ncbi:MAG TPA: AarF/ABC1/UbiB kinase family protein [Polyangiales bacterium]|nr:AarF/ABC1/UbiB kinase family protein [Polyangiales bacterium]
MNSDSKQVPSGRLARLSGLARAGLRSGTSLLLSRDADAAARHAAQVLGRLRGLAAKVGQMASYVDGMVPDGQREAYELAMRGLRAAAPSSPPDVVRALIESELGASIEALFARFETVPFASASIGQVHRAELSSGQAVAVKVQHPGIEAAIEADLKNVSVLETFVGALGPKALDSRRLMREIAARFREELDYRLEADRQTQFKRIHACDPMIQIPAVIPERSARRVLTTELVSGETLEWASEQPEALRRRYAEVLWRFVFRGNLVGGLFNADPHPGNYLFQPSGKIAFLDFGCVQPIGPDRLRQARRLHAAARRGDEATFREYCVQILKTRGGSYEEAAIAHSRATFEPLFASPFHMTREFVQGMVQNALRLKEQLFAKDKSFVPLPDGILFMNRLQFGFYSVLARLEVAADYRRVEDELCVEAGIAELL